jgi:phospholipase/carboxylesterase
MDHRAIGDWVLKERRPAGQGPFRFHLLLHGWTGDENSMDIFSKTLPADTWLVAPRGVYVSALGGYSWFRDQGKTWPWVDDFRPAIEALFDLMELKKFPGANFERVDLMGFSQGAALAYALAFLYPQRVNQMAGLAGFMPEGCEALGRNQPLKGKHIFVAHGRLDELVPIEKGRHCVSVLKGAGGEVVYCEDEVGHKLSKGCFGEMKKFFNEPSGSQGRRVVNPGSSASFERRIGKWAKRGSSQSEGDR